MSAREGDLSEEEDGDGRDVRVEIDRESAIAELLDEVTFLESQARLFAPRVQLSPADAGNGLRAAACGPKNSEIFFVSKIVKYFSWTATPVACPVICLKHPLRWLAAVAGV